MTDFVALKNESLSDFSARSVLVRHVEDFKGLREWCEANFPGNLPVITAYGESRTRWTIRAIFEGDDAQKHASLFKLFWLNDG